MAKSCVKITFDSYFLKLAFPKFSRHSTISDHHDIYFVEMEITYESTSDFLLFSIFVFSIQSVPAKVRKLESRHFLQKTIKYALFVVFAFITHRNFFPLKILFYFNFWFPFVSIWRRIPFRNGNSARLSDASKCEALIKIYFS